MLASLPGIKSALPELESEVLNHWTAREVPEMLLLSLLSLQPLKTERPCSPSQIPFWLWYLSHFTFGTFHITLIYAESSGCCVRFGEPKSHAYNGAWRGKGGWGGSSWLTLWGDRVHDVGKTPNRERHGMTNGHCRVQDELDVMVSSFHKQLSPTEQALPSSLISGHAS